MSSSALLQSGFLTGLEVRTVARAGFRIRHCSAEHIRLAARARRGEGEDAGLAVETLPECQATAFLCEVLHRHTSEVIYGQGKALERLGSAGILS